MTITMGKRIPEWEDNNIAMMTTSIDSDDDILYTYDVVLGINNKGGKLDLNDVLHREKYYIGAHWKNMEYWRSIVYKRYVRLINQYLVDAFKAYHAVFHKYLADNQITNPKILYNNTCACNPAMTDILCSKCRDYNNNVFTAIDKECKAKYPKISSLLKNMRAFTLNETDELNVIQMSIVKQSIPKDIIAQVNEIWEDDVVPSESDAYVFCNGKLQLHTTVLALIMKKPDRVIDAIFEKAQGVNTAVKYELAYMGDTSDTTSPTATFIDASDFKLDDYNKSNTSVYVKREQITYSKWKADMDSGVGVESASTAPPVKMYQCKKKANLNRCKMSAIPLVVYVYTFELYECDFDMNFNSFVNEDLVALKME